MSDYIIVEQSPALHGEIAIDGAKNAVLVIIASLLLTRGTSRLTNVPRSADVFHMIHLLENLGAIIVFDQEQGTLEINTSTINSQTVSFEIMKKMRA